MQVSSPTVSRMVEDYVTLIWKAYELPGQGPSTTDLASRLGVTASTVSANLKKLARDGMIEYEAYGSISLTPSGRKIAVEVVRRHRIVETYLVECLGLTWDLVHDEADLLEHAVSELVLDQMDKALGYPQRDPHGDPIPDRDGRIVADTSVPLSSLEVGTRCRVARVSDRSPEILRFLHKHGVSIGLELRLESVQREVSVVQVLIGSDLVGLTGPAASAVRVDPI